MLKIKSGPQGCRVAGLRPEALLGIMICHSVCADHGWGMRLTSVTDSEHSPGSLHYPGLAFDFALGGSLGESDSPSEFAHTFKTALGDDYDVVDEGNHFHVEFQPKTPINGG